MAENWEIKELYKLKHSPFKRKPNYFKIPTTRLHYNTQNIELFNSIYLTLMKKKKHYTEIIRTPSGGISLNKPPLAATRQYDVRQSGAFIEMTIINNDGCWRVQMAAGKKSSELGENPILSGKQAFFRFREFLKENYKIILEDFAIEDGEIVNHTIEKPLIFMRHETITANKTFEGVHHIDFHNSYPAGLANTHEEFREAITFLYNNRYKKPEYKDLLNFTIGFMHSKFVKYQYAHLARDAIADSNKRVMALARRVELAGGRILLFNTDGFWYKGEIYHGAGEGRALGQWSNDHVNCKFRAKSAGAYEFIENETYNPVIRGYTKLDELKDRGNWEWGDIYQENAEIKQYKFDEEKGIIEV